MTHKEYVERLKEEIINRVKYHAPMVSEGVDYSLLAAYNIDETLPIFVYKKPLDKHLCQAFLEAKKQCDFNLILTEKPRISTKKLKNCYIIFEDEIGGNLSLLFEKLNINYSLKSDYKIKRNKEFIKINNQEIKLDFIPFYNHKKVMFNGVICTIKQFLLNGNNIAIDLANTREELNEISLEINIPLPRGYYFFKKYFNRIEIENLTCKNKAIFNYFLPEAKINFSCLDGIFSSTFACINLTANIAIKGGAKKTMFFNFGSEEFLPNNPKEMQEIFSLSQQSMYEIFDTKIISRNDAEDHLFNLELPKKIWKAWSRFSCDQANEERWLALKSRYIKNVDCGIEVNRDNKQLKSVKLYRQGGWKSVYIVRGDSTYLFAGRTKYYNYTLLSNELFSKNNEIYLSFVN